MLAVVAVIIFLGVGGNIWLLVQEARGRIRTRGWNTRLLRVLAASSAAVVLGTTCFARPWYWDLLIAAVAIAGLVGVFRCLRALWHPPNPGLGRAITLSASAVLLGVALLGLAGVAGVLDGAALSSTAPVVSYHGGGVLRSPVLYQLFWGSQWGHRPSPALDQALTFEDRLAGSAWSDTVAGSGFGISGLRAGQCWIDPAGPPRGTIVAGTSSGPLHDELAAVFGGRHPVRSCAGGPDHPPAALPEDAVVAVWLPPQAVFQISGVAEHGWTPWPGRPGGLVVAGLPGAYAYWGLPGCVDRGLCGAIPAYASPSYALSHELLEAATNPYGGGWFAPAPLSWTASYVLSNGPPSLLGLGTRPSYPGEVADLCQPGAVAPGQHLVFGRLDPGTGIPVASFFRPGTGCVV